MCIFVPLTAVTQSCNNEFDILMLWTLLHVPMHTYFRTYFWILSRLIWHLKNWNRTGNLKCNKCQVHMFVEFWQDHIWESGKDFRTLHKASMGDRHSILFKCMDFCKEGGGGIWNGKNIWRKFINILLNYGPIFVHENEIPWLYFTPFEFTSDRTQTVNLQPGILNSGNLLGACFKDYHLIS